MTQSITALDARVRLGELLDQVRYSGEPCTILRHGRPVAVLVDHETWQELSQRAAAQALPAQYDHWIQQVVEILRAKYAPEKIILFGSAAKGALRPGSDIDLCIIKRTRKRRLDRIDEAVALLPPEIPLDVVVYTPQEWGKMIRDKDAMAAEILAGKVLFDAK